MEETRNMKLKELIFTADERNQIKKYIQQINQNISKQDMTPLQRMNLVINHKKPDRVPVCLSSMEHTSRSIGASVRDIMMNPKKAILADLGTLATYNCDSVCSAYAEPHVIGTEELGTKVFYPENSSPVLKDFALKDLKDVEKLEIPDPYKDGKLPIVLQIIEFLRDKIGDQVPIWQCLNGPFGHAGDLRGYTQLMRDLVQNPSMAHALMEFCTEVAVTIAKAVQTAGAVPWPFDALSSPEYIGEKRYFDLVYPYQKKMVHRLTPPGTMLGIDGNVSDIIDEYADTGALAIHVDAGLNLIGLKGPNLSDVAEFKRRIGQKTTLLVQCIKIPHLKKGSPEEIKRLMNEIMSLLGPGANFILETDVVPLDIPEQNLKNIMELILTYGKYEN
jgi:uroporphyrinogen decarboxylase